MSSNTKNVDLLSNFGPLFLFCSDFNARVDLVDDGLVVESPPTATRRTSARSTHFLARLDESLTLHAAIRIMCIGHRSTVHVAHILRGSKTAAS